MIAQRIDDSECRQTHKPHSLHTLLIPNTPPVDRYLFHSSEVSLNCAWIPNTTSRQQVIMPVQKKLNENTMRSLHSTATLPFTSSRYLTLILSTLFHRNSICHHPSLSLSLDYRISPHTTPSPKYFHLLFTFHSSLTNPTMR